CQSQSILDKSSKNTGTLDPMISRQYKHYRLWIVSAKVHSCQPDGCRSVPEFWFKQNVSLASGKTLKVRQLGADDQFLFHPGHDPDPLGRDELTHAHHCVFQQPVASE